MNTIDSIHEKAQSLARHYLSCEATLIDCLEEVESCKVYLAKGYSSVFSYAVKALNLSESTAYALIAVARKSKQVPELKTEIQSGRLTVSKASRIVSVINSENKTLWIEKSKNLPKQKLELEIAKVSPKPKVQERVTAVAETRVKIQQGMETKDFDKLSRVQDLLSQKLKRHVSREEALAMTLEFYLEKNDPVREAERLAPNEESLAAESRSSTLPRAELTGKTTKQPLKSLANANSVTNAAQKNPTTLPRAESATTSRHLPQRIKHLVFKRDQGQCTFVHPESKTRCCSRRWIDIHHHVPISRGGQNTVKNLVTLCKAHHRWVHRVAKM